MKKKERIEALEREVQEIKYFINENIDELYGKTPFGKVAPPSEEWKPLLKNMIASICNGIEDVMAQRMDIDDFEEIMPLVIKELYKRHSDTKPPKQKDNTEG